MRCLVTGAAGFIGSHLVERLLSDGHTVLGIDGFFDNYARSLKESQLAPSAEHRKFDFVDEFIQRLDLHTLLDGVERVFHLAAVPGVRSSWGNSFEGYSSHNDLQLVELRALLLRGTGKYRFIIRLRQVS